MFVKGKSDAVTEALSSVLYDRLTSPTNEDWIIIPNGELIWVTSLTETKDSDGAPQVKYRSGEYVTKDLRSLVTKLVNGHNLGCVTIIITKDAEETGAYKLLTWMNTQAKMRNFSLTSLIGRTTAAEAIEAAKARHLQTAGNA